VSELVTRHRRGCRQPFTDHAVAIGVNVMAGSRRVLLIIGLGLGLRHEVIALAFARTAGPARDRRRCSRRRPRPAVQFERRAGRLRCSFGRG